MSLETFDLFPETIQASAEPVIYESHDTCNKWGFPRVVVRLLPQWSDTSGYWTVGWFCNVDHAVDEWMPGTVPASGWPWYRTTQQPFSNSYALACALAGRAAKIVLAQMEAYAECDAAKRAISQVQERIEAQAVRWLTGIDNNSIRPG